ncbi:nucleotidyl transferase AbiEii/AbiGii toxin family protein [Myroides sp. LJL116]
MFKGGTSLSKAYSLIQRFSEDIDLIVDRHLVSLILKHKLKNLERLLEDLLLMNLEKS